MIVHGPILLVQQVRACAAAAARVSARTIHAGLTRLRRQRRRGPGIARARGRPESAVCSALSRFGRDRRADIPLLVGWFLGQFRSATGKHVEDVSNEAMRTLLNHAWPGNVRELRNAIEYAVIGCSGRALQPANLPPELRYPHVVEPSLEDALTGADVRSRLIAALKRRTAPAPSPRACWASVGRRSIAGWPSSPGQRGRRAAHAWSSGRCLRAPRDSAETAGGSGASVESGRASRSGRQDGGWPAARR
jgi:hypothetical protein